MVGLAGRLTGARRDDGAVEVMTEPDQCSAERGATGEPEGMELSQNDEDRTSGGRG